VILLYPNKEVLQQQWYTFQSNLLIAMEALTRTHAHTHTHSLSVICFNCDRHHGFLNRYTDQLTSLYKISTAHSTTHQW